MRNLNWLHIYRDERTHLGPGDHANGVFRIPSTIDNVQMLVIASSGLGWEHVSVSRSTRCPNWPEMSQIKQLFFRDDEVVMQLHVAKKDHINCHPYCLHLWRPLNADIPLPPRELVGPT